MSAVAVPVMERLKSETAARHEAAEHHPFQRALAAGQLPREQYIANLGQLYLVHRALENALRAAAPRVPAILKIVLPYQYQEQYLAEDLAFLAAGSTPAASPATSRITAEIARAASDSPVRLLGMHYVLEGSKNGAKYFCRNVQRAYSLAPGAGTRYLDPYGDQQRAYWARFKTDMTDAGFTQAEADELVAGAADMFDAIAAIGDDIMHNRTN